MTRTQCTAIGEAYLELDALARRWRERSQHAAKPLGVRTLIGIPAPSVQDEEPFELTRPALTPVRFPFSLV